MDKRKSQILTRMVDDYINTAEPVSSGKLAKLFNLSSATLRNEMAELEKNGYVYQPHTSAGRIPTEKAYKFYLTSKLPQPAVSIPAEYKKALTQIVSLKYPDSHVLLKNLAKKLSQLSGQAIIIAFADNDTFYTGISYLFKQPEFAKNNYLQIISYMIDQLDDSVQRVFDSVDTEVTILIGKENPFGDQCTSMLTKYQLPDKKFPEQGLLGLLGPMRMPYGLNKTMLEYVQNLLKNTTNF